MERTTVPARRVRGAVPVLVAAVLAGVLGSSTPAQAAPRERTPTLPDGPARSVEAQAPVAPGSDAQAAAEAAVASSPTRSVSALVITHGQADVVSVDAAPSQVARVAAELESRPGVVAVDVDTPRWADGAVDPYRWDQWGLDALNMDLVPAGVADDSALRIAVVDSGVLASHEDLAGKVRCDLGADFVADPVNGTGGNGCVDPRGHGTHVAGEIAAIPDNGLGIAGVSNAAIIPVRVLNGEGWGTTEAVAAGIIRAVDQGADVINLSLGSAAPNDVEAAAVRYALDHDVVVVASAGNSRQEGNPVNYPAAHPGVISVAASDEDGLSTYFSSTRSNTLVTAPGARIVSTSATGRSSYGYASGTSMAAPYVAGIVSRYRALHPTATVADVRAAVQATAIDMERPGRDDNTGYGMIDALELLTGRNGPAMPVVATPGAATITQVLDGNGAVAVRWAAPSYSGTSAITSYDLDVWRYSGGSWNYLRTLEVGPTARSATLTGLRNGYPHVVVIWPWNRYGYGQGAESPAVTPLRRRAPARRRSARPVRLPARPSYAGLPQRPTARASAATWSRPTGAPPWCGRSSRRAAPPAPSSAAWPTGLATRSGCRPPTVSAPGPGRRSAPPWCRAPSPARRGSSARCRVTRRSPCAGRRR
jgi:Subtilase family